jgi:uncharacterized membrane protein
MLSIVLALAEQPEELAPMIAPPWVFAVIAASIFTILAFVSWSFRDVANRHSDKTSTTDNQSSHH